MASDNIFSGLKVVDLASFIAGPGAAVILSDFGADVIKVEPPTGDLWRMGYKIPPQPQAKDAYPWHLANRNKRGMALDLKSPSAQQVLERLVKWADVLIVNTPHPARKKLKLEYDDVAQWNPRLIYADVTGFGEKGPGRAASGLRHHVVLGTQRSAVADARRRRAADLAGSRQRRQCHRRRPVFGDRHGALSARAHRQGLVCHDLAARRGRLVGERLDPGRALRGEVLPAARSQQSRQCGVERLPRCRRHLVRDRRDAGQVGRRWRKRSAARIS